MKKKLSLVIITAIAIMSTMTSCGNKETTDTTEPTLNEFTVDKYVAKYPKYDHINDYDDHDYGDRKNTSDNQESKSSSDSKDDTDTKGYGMAELEITGEDNTQYYKIDGDDIIYGDVRYRGLYKAIKSCKQPYGENTFLNFIVKTYNPEADDITVMYYNEDEPETVKNLSQGIADDLRNNWDGYTFLKTKYNTDVKWMLFIYETESGGRQARIYGCKEYLVYAGSSGVLEVNMSAYKNNAPVGAK